MFSNNARKFLYICSLYPLMRDPRERNVQNFTRNMLSEPRKQELIKRAEIISEELPGDQSIHIERFDHSNGHASVITSKNGPTEDKNYVNRALHFLTKTSPAFGASEDKAPEFLADPVPVSTSSNATAVYALQTLHGIRIFQAGVTVKFDPNGSLVEATGTVISTPTGIQVSPKLTVQQAVQKAAEFLAQPRPEDQHRTDQFGEPLTVEPLNLSEFKPQVVSTISNDPSLTTILEGSPFPDRIKANLLWFPQSEDNLRLGYEVVMNMPNYSGQYRLIVDAETGDILYSRQLMKTLKARGNVFERYGNPPNQTVIVDFPRMIQDLKNVYDLRHLDNNSIIQKNYNLPDSFPLDWVIDETTRGTNTFAHLEDSGPTAKGTRQSNIINFDSTNPNDLLVVNMFYHCNVLHDIWYMLGFTKEAGNFEVDNLGSDPVDARVYPHPVSGTANFSTPPDGTSPIMRMGLVSRTNRPTCCDPDVMYHEFMHGVTNRLVGGRMNTQAMDSLQAAGIGEGTSDYNACSLLNKTVCGDWVLNNKTGVRKYQYDEQFPDTFANLGTGRYGEQDYDEHAVGEIWAATLLQMNRKIEEKINIPRIGAYIGLRLIADACKICTPNPSFLNLRDAMLKALDDHLTANQISKNDYLKIRQSIWEAFVKFGMGPNASCNGSQLSGIVPDFNMPDLSQ
jgi:extracellular elastinolytic metalloproteinase